MREVPTKVNSSQGNQGQSPPSGEARAAGLSGGTGFAGIVLLMPKGTIQSMLLILAPAITLVISSSWHLLANEINTRVADWRIRNQRKRVEALLKALNNNPSSSDELKRQAQSDLDALVLLEVEISKKRVQAIVAS
jgi:hypothetical protein